MKAKDSLIRIAFLALFLFLTIRGKMALWLLLFALSLPVALLFGRIRLSDPHHYAAGLSAGS
jgi:hypothetical protein